MFIKKFLSVLGLLFLGNLVSVQAAVVADLTACSTAMSDWNEGSPTPCTETTIASCCIYGNKLYKINDITNTCGSEAQELGPGIHVINKAGTSSGELTLGSGDYTSNLDNILLYICDDTTCTRTYGYIKDESNYYSILVGGNTKLTEGTEIATPTGTSTTCSGNKGKLIKPTDPGTTVYLCLKDDVSIAFPGTGVNSANYLMDKVEGTVTSDSNGDNTKVVMETDDYAVALNVLYTDEEYCVYATNLLMNRVDNFCQGSILDNLYSCTEGLCSVSGSPISAGKYIVSNKLYSCTGAGPVSCALDEDTDNLIVVEETVNENEYEMMKMVDDITGVTSIAEVGHDYFLYHCKSGNCARTDGFIKYNTDTIATCTTGAKCADGTTDITISSKTLTSGFEFDSTAVPSDKSYFFTGDANAFIIIKNNGGNMIGQAKYVDAMVYVTPSGEITTEAAFNGCTTAGIIPYTITGNISGTYSAGSQCISSTPCQLDATAANNVNCLAGYYLKSTTGGNTGNLVKDDNEAGTLYLCEDVDGQTYKDCKSATAANVKSGYYKNEDTIEGVQYIKCTADSNTCNAVVVSDNDCGTAGIGGLIVDSSNPTLISLCIDDNTNAVHLSTTSVQYFISIDEENAFGDKTGYYVIVDFDGKNALKNEVTTTPKYRYTNANQQILKRNDNSSICSDPATKATIKEFLQDKDEMNPDKTTYYDTSAPPS